MSKAFAESMRYIIRRKLLRKSGCITTFPATTLHIGKVCGILCLRTGPNGIMSGPMNGFNYVQANTKKREEF